MTKPKSEKYTQEQLDTMQEKLQDDQCQYCNLTKRELKIVQSELSDAYVMLQNRDNTINELERKLKYYEAKGE